MLLYQVNQLTNEIAHRKEKIYDLKSKHGETDGHVIRLSGEVKELNQAYQAILSNAYKQLTRG